LARYTRLANWIDNVPEHYVLVRDPKDSKYLNLAIEAKSPYVVTADLDLLDLMDPASAAGQDFRNRYPTVQVVTPSAFLAIVSATSP
jgi:predicted nucleic acid-binding protein